MGAAGSPARKAEAAAMPRPDLVLADASLAEDVEIGRVRLRRAPDGRLELACFVRCLAPRQVWIETQVEFLDACGEVYGDATTRRVARVPVDGRVLLRATSSRARACRAVLRVWRVDCRESRR